MAMQRRAGWELKRGMAALNYAQPQNFANRANAAIDAINLLLALDFEATLLDMAERFPLIRDDLQAARQRLRNYDASAGRQALAGESPPANGWELSKRPGLIQPPRAIDI